MSEEIKQVEKIAEGTDDLKLQQGERLEESGSPQESVSAEMSAVPQEKGSEETAQVKDADKTGSTEEKNAASEAQKQVKPEDETERHAYRKGNPFKRSAYLGDEDEMARDEWILSRLRDEDLMDYLTLEHRKAEMLQKAKETRERRLFFLVQLIISLAAIVAVVYCLQSEPVVLVNILYITGIVIVLWIWKNPKDKSESKQ